MHPMMTPATKVDPMMTPAGLRVLASVAIAAEAHRAHGNDPVPAAAFTTLALSGARDTADVEQGDLLAYLAVVPVNVANICSHRLTAPDVAAAFAASPQHSFVTGLSVPAEMTDGEARALLGAANGFPCARAVRLAGNGAGLVFAALGAPQLRSTSFSRLDARATMAVVAQLAWCGSLRSLTLCGALHAGSEGAVQAALARAIRGLPQLRRLTLTNFALGNEHAVAALCSAIAAGPRAIHLVVGRTCGPSGCAFIPPAVALSAATAACFAAPLRANRVAGLTLCSSPWVGDRGAAALAEGVSASSALRSLHLPKCGIAATGAAALAAALMKRPTMRSISLSGNPLLDEGVTQLAAGLGACVGLAHIALANVQLSNAAAAGALASAVSGMKFLRSLVMTDHRFGDAAMSTVVDAATTCPALVELFLGVHVRPLPRGAFSDATVASMAALVRSSASLRGIDFCGCGLTSGNAAVLADAAATSGLDTVQLCHNAIGDGGAVAWAAVAMDSGTLRHLELAGNQLGEMGALAMAEALAAPWCALRALSLQGNPIPAAAAAAIRAVARRGVTVVSADVPAEPAKWYTENVGRRHLYF
jgi:hypothetical protein